MKVLHVASFSGNSGDIINHQGFVRQFLKYVCPHAVFDREEIRSYYKNRNERSFDELFVDLANQYDLVIIGGGNFLSPWIDSSQTGTTIDFGIKELSKIKVPLLFLAVGCEGSLGSSKISIDKLKKFLDYLLLSNRAGRFYLSVRNDGSHEFIQTHLGRKYSEKVHAQPDNGFFCRKPRRTRTTRSVLGLSVS